MFKKALKIGLCFTLLIGMLSTAIPLHNILHQHYFIKADGCGFNACKKHLKNYSKPCCTHSDAVFLSDLPQEIHSLPTQQPSYKLTLLLNEGSYYQFYHLTKNKAPPVMA